MVEVISVCVHMCEAFAPPQRPYKNCDFFAGKCAISKAFRANNHAACSLDIAIDERDESQQNMRLIYS